MDLTGRTAAYRGAVVRCPACGELMGPDPASTAQPQVCGACDGLWIDWFDGEVHAIAAEHEAARVRGGTPLPGRPSKPLTGSGSCPRCAGPLTAELSRFSDATDDDLITGVEVLRCPECSGVFVPRGSAHLLLERLRERRTQSPIAALRGLVALMFGRDRE